MAQDFQQDSTPLWGYTPSTNTSLQDGLSGAQPMHPVVRALMHVIGALPNDQLTSTPQQGLAPSAGQAWLGSIPKSKGELALQMALPLLGMAAGPVVKGLAGMGGEAAETAPTFYSNVLDAFNNPKLPNKLTREQALSVLNSPGVKSEENKWLDLPNFLGSKDKWTRGEIQDYIRQNQISVKDVTSTGPQVRHVVDWTLNPIDDETFKNWRRQEYQKGVLTKHEDGSYTHDPGPNVDFAPNITPEQLRGTAHYHMFNNRNEWLVARDRASKGLEPMPFDTPEPPDVGYPNRTTRPFSTEEAARAFMANLPKEAQGQYEAEEMPGSNTPRHSQYTLSGGKNYREVLLKWDNPRTQPGQEQTYGIWHKGINDWLGEKYPTQAAAQNSLNQRAATFADMGLNLNNLEVQPRGGAAPEFVGGHFDEPNILAHLRLTDRTTPDGKKVLFMEEAQSDWQKQLRESDKSSGSADERGSWEYEASKLMHDKGLGDWAPLNKYDTENIEKFGNRYGDLPGESLSSYRGEPVPEAPLARNYPELAMKRVLRMAAEQGYDSVGWTTGKQQADRYNQILLQSVKGVTYDPSTQELIAETPQGPKSYITSVEQLPGFVGKDAARKLLQGVETGPNGTQPARLEGSDLQLGERGYSDLYDKQLPSIADKWGKKFGARVSTGQITTGGETPGGTTVHTIPITPALKQSALAKGFPLFAVGGAAGLAAMNRERLARERNRNTEPDTYVMH